MTSYNTRIIVNYHELSKNDIFVELTLILPQVILRIDVKRETSVTSITRPCLSGLGQ